MRILITGGAGFIGSHIADAALAAGHEVMALDDLSSGKRDNLPEGVALEVADICDGEAVSRILSDFRPDAISHQAAQVSVSVSAREPQRDARVNIEGSLNVLSAAVQAQVKRVVFASTGGAIYGEIEPPVRAPEERTPLPLSPYACAKLSVENYLRFFEHEHGLKSTVLRYANVYGPRQDPHGEAGVVAIFCQRLLKGEPIQVNAKTELGDDGCIRDYVFVGDVVRANMAAIEERIEEPVLNVCTGVESTTRTLADRLREATGSSSEVKDGPRRAGDVERSVLDPTRFLKLGADLKPIDQGLQETADWFKSQG